MILIIEPGYDDLHAGLSALSGGTATDGKYLAGLEQLKRQ